MSKGHMDSTLTHEADQFLVFNATHLAEVMPVECQRGLRSQFEEMELCSEDLLSPGHRGQIEPVLHLLAAHCKWEFV